MTTSFSGNSPVIIIGAGVAGLTAANLLVRNGFTVAVFEAGEKVGGCCATTTVEGYTFHDGAVYLALLSILDHASSRVGLNRIDHLPLRKITAKSSATLPDGSVVTLGEDLDLTVTRRAVDQERARNELRRMAEKWMPVLRFVGEDLALRPFSSWHLLRKGWRHVPKLRGTAASEFNRLFSDEAVKSALSGALLYNGLPAEELPVSAILGLVAEVGEGLYLPEGGMGRIPQVLNCALQARGVAISLSSKVGKIVIKDRRVRAIEVDGRQVDAAAVISTASGMETLGTLLDAEYLSPTLVRKLKHPRLSHKAASIQFGLSNRIEASAHTVSALPWMAQQQEIFEQDGRVMKYPICLFPTLTMPELAPRGGSIIEMFYPVRADLPLEYWTEERKQRLADLAIAELRSKYDPHITVTRVRTPKDFRDSMNLFQGALYGLSPASTPRDQFPHSGVIRGLFLAGQTTFPGYGVGAAMMSGVFAAEALLETA
jgi:phytoene dehydrogenase-like protein